MLSLNDGTCTGCRVTEHMELLDAKLAPETGEPLGLWCIACYGPGWAPTGLSSLSLSIVPGYRQRYRAWLRREKLRRAIATVTSLHDADLGTGALERLLVEGATCSYRGGTNELRFAGVTGTATSNAPRQLMRSWLGKAQRKLERLP